MPRWLKYYERENERHQWAESIGCSDSAALFAIAALTDAFLAKSSHVPVSFSRGHKWSFGGPDGIRLAKGRTWLMLAHEFAHVWDFQLRQDSKHDDFFAALVDQVVEHIQRMGWPFADLQKSA